MLRALLGSVLAGSVLAGCGPKVDNSRVKLPTPVQSTTLGPGDLFTLEVVGEKDLPREFHLDHQGPHLQAFKRILPAISARPMLSGVST